MTHISLGQLTTAAAATHRQALTMTSSQQQAAKINRKQQYWNENGTDTLHSAAVRLRLGGALGPVQHNIVY